MCQSERLGKLMLAKDQWRKELADQGFVPYGEVVRLRRLCWLAWALVGVILIVLFSGKIGAIRSSGVASHARDSQPSHRGHLEASYVRQLPRAPRLSGPLSTF
jgi:hypothetical protein